MRRRQIAWLLMLIGLVACGRPEPAARPATHPPLGLAASARSGARPAIEPTATPELPAAPAGGTATPLPCATATPEPFWVEPVVSPTDLLTQTIVIYAGRAMTVTISAESGVYTQTNGPTWPARITITLLPNTTHNLLVTAHIPRIMTGHCAYGGYHQTRTATIVQAGGAAATPTVTPTATITPTPIGSPQQYLPAFLRLNPPASP